MFPHPRVVREGTDERAPEPSSAEASAGDHAIESGRLSLMELVVAELGGWVSAVCYRCHLPVGPFLVSDGVVHMDLAIFCGEVREREEPSTPQH